MNLLTALAEGATFAAAAVGIAYAGMKLYFSSYLKEKGKNLATKEDIQDITDKIESVKHEYAKQLEALKTDFSAKLKTHGFRYEKEYAILEELASLLVDIQKHSRILNVRQMQYGNKPSPVNQREVDEKISKELIIFLEKLEDFSQKKKPFFAENIFKSIDEVRIAARVESYHYEWREETPGNNANGLKELAERNQRILTLTQDALETIRKRTIEWEKITTE